MVSTSRANERNLSLKHGIFGLLFFVVATAACAGPSAAQGSWIGFANDTSPQDRETELARNCGTFTRATATQDFSSFAGLCQSLGKSCVKVCDWEGTQWSCDEQTKPGQYGRQIGRDGSRVALCVDLTTAEPAKNSSASEAAKAADEGSNLKVMMSFIEETMNGQGKISWTADIRIDDIRRSAHPSEEITGFTADPVSCQVTYDLITGDDDYSTVEHISYDLRTVTNVVVTSKDEERPGTYQSHNSSSVRNYPDVLALNVRGPMLLHREQGVSLTFADASKANRIADGILRASKLCREKSKETESRITDAARGASLQKIDRLLRDRLTGVGTMSWTSTLYDSDSRRGNGRPGTWRQALSSFTLGDSGCSFSLYRTVAPIPAFARHIWWFTDTENAKGEQRHDWIQTDSRSWLEIHNDGSQSGHAVRQTGLMVGGTQGSVARINDGGSLVFIPNPGQTSETSRMLLIQDANDTHWKQMGRFIEDARARDEHVRVSLADIRSVRIEPLEDALNGFWILNSAGSTIERISSPSPYALDLQLSDDRRQILSVPDSETAVRVAQGIVDAGGLCGGGN